MEWWSMGVMGGHRIVRRGEYQLIRLLALLRLVFDTALRGKVRGAVESAATLRQAGVFDSRWKWAEMGKGGLEHGLTWEKAGRRWENGVAFSTSRPPFPAFSHINRRKSLISRISA